MRSEMLERVFDLFVQADDSLDRSSGGFGVGLTLVRSIAELHGGRVLAHSAGPGQGSEFVVWLPLASVSHAPTVSPHSSTRLPSWNILLVEDNDDGRRMLETMLKLDGHDVAVSRDVKQALALIRSARPAVVLVDIGRPTPDRCELARQVRREENAYATYLVAITACSRAEDRRVILEAGFDEYLLKPLKREDLERVFERALQRCSGAR
jgi:CheY-like chemotaxis protein